MGKHIVESRKVHAKYYEKKEKSINREEDFPSKQASEESDQSCLTEEEEELEEGEIRSDHNSKKRRREATTIACESRKLQGKYHEKEKSINKEDDFLSKQVSEESEKSCLTEEEELEEGEIRCDQNNKKRRREATTIACESKKRTKHNKESRYDNTSFDDWLFGTTNHQKNGTIDYKKAAIKIADDDKDVINTKLQRSSGAFVAFPRAQFLSHVGIFSLPYTVIF